MNNPYKQKYRPRQIAAGIIAFIVTFFLFGACTYAVIQSEQGNADRCEAAGGFYEYDDGECEFPYGDDD